MALREHSLNAFYLPISIVINLLTPFVILYNVTPIEQELINFPLSSMNAFEGEIKKTELMKLIESK